MNQKPRLGPGGGWVGEVLGLIFTGYVPLASQNPYPIIVYSVRQICYFRDPSLVTFYFYELTHFLDWMKNTLLFLYSKNILVRLLTVNMKNCLTPESPKMCNPILVTLLKMRPHYGQSSRENGTPSSGTSPLASYKEAPPPPPGCCAFGCHLRAWSKGEATCRFLPTLSEVLNADLGQRTKDI